MSVRQTHRRACRSDWRINWRTRHKLPANRHVRVGLENRFGPLGPTRVQIPPPPLNGAVRLAQAHRWSRAAFRRPHLAVHRSPHASAQIHALSRSLANDWRADPTRIPPKSTVSGGRLSPGSLPVATAVFAKPRRRRPPSGEVKISRSQHAFRRRATCSPDFRRTRLASAPSTGRN